MPSADVSSEGSRRSSGALKLYQEHLVDKAFERAELFSLLAERYKIQSALYPGSFVHVTPSFFFASVVYVDSDRRCPRFFNDAAVLRMIKRRRQYAAEPKLSFHAQDYTQPLAIPEASVDLLISQWAGPVSQACKRSLKIGGVLVANDSHADASLAHWDDDYELTATLSRRGQHYRFDEVGQAAFFQPKSGKTLTREQVERLGRGPGYSRSPAAYVFRRVG